MGRVVSRTQCPKCASNGRDRKGDNLAVYEDGSSYCHACSYYSKGGEQRMFNQTKQEDITKYLAYPVRQLTHKPISKEIAERYGVRCVANVETGAIDGVLYPYYSEGSLVAFKARSLPKQFVNKGDTSKMGLFGQQLFKKGGRMLLITEGEDDTLAIAEMLHRRGKNYSVVSIPNGADQNGVIDNKVKQQYDYLSSFENVVICFDNDKPGVTTAKSLADWLAPSTKVRILTIPDGYKDASDLLVDDKIDLFWKLLADAPEYSPEGIYNGEAITIEELKKPLQKGYLTPYSGLDDKLKGFRKGELTLFTAGSSIGKSTLARELSYHFVKHHGLRVANIFLEETMEKTALSFIALDNNVPLPKLRLTPDMIGEERFNQSYKELVANGRNFFYKHFGSLANDTLMAKFRYFANALDVDFIFLDHISMVISGQDDNNERKSIDLLMTELAAFCNETGVGVIAVVHLKRKGNSGGKEKSYNEGGQVSLTDLRGSGGLEQMSWNVVALERNQQDPEEANFSTVRVLKNREWGFTGKCERLFFNSETGRLLPAPEPEEYYDE